MRPPHEIYSAQHDDRLFKTRGYLSQRKAVAYIIGEVLNLALLVVVGEYHRAPFLLQTLNLFLKVDSRLYRSVDVTFFCIHNG